jgi:hypothetical protein
MSIMNSLPVGSIVDATTFRACKGVAQFKKCDAIREFAEARPGALLAKGDRSSGRIASDNKLLPGTEPLAPGIAGREPRKMLRSGPALVELRVESEV